MIKAVFQICNFFASEQEALRENRDRMIDYLEEKLICMGVDNPKILNCSYVSESGIFYILVSTSSSVDELRKVYDFDLNLESFDLDAFGHAISAFRSCINLTECFKLSKPEMFKKVIDSIADISDDIVTDLDENNFGEIIIYYDYFDQYIQSR